MLFASFSRALALAFAFPFASVCVLVFMRVQSQMECVQLPGDIVYVPGGYEHAVLNLRASIGVAVQFGDDYPNELLRRLLVKAFNQSNANTTFDNHSPSVKQ